MSQIGSDWNGAHFRDDYPAKSDDYSTFNIVLTKGAEPHIKIEESRELMRILEQCRKRARF